MWPADPAHRPNARPSLVRRRRQRSPRSASRSCRRSSRAGSTRSTRPAAGRCSSWSPARCASASRRGSPRPRWPRSATRTPNEIELLWPGLAPPYTELFAWLEGRADKPVSSDPAPFRPVMLAHAIEEADFAALDPADFIAEWKWDGIRVQAVAGAARTASASRGSIRAPARTSPRAFPIWSRRCDFDGAIDGELLILRDGRVQIVQRPAAAAQPQDRHAEAARRISRASARLRSAGRRRRGPARPAVRRAARAAGSLRRRGSTIRASTSRRWCRSTTWDELDRRARRSASAGAGDDAERSKA